VKPILSLLLGKVPLKLRFYDCINPVCSFFYWSAAFVNRNIKYKEMKDVLNTFIWIPIKIARLYLHRSWNQYFYRYAISILVISVFFYSKHLRKFYLSRMEEIFIYCLTCRFHREFFKSSAQTHENLFQRLEWWKINTGSFDCPLVSSLLHTYENMSRTYCQHISDELHMK